VSGGKALIDGPSIAIGTQFGDGLKLPKRHHLSASEELAVILAVAPLRGDGPTDSEALLRCNVKLAAIAMRRIVPTYSEEQAAELSMSLVVALGNYLLAERRGWQGETQTGCCAMCGQPRTNLTPLWFRDAAAVGLLKAPAHG
jgi:hypothetical protein